MSEFSNLSELARFVGQSSLSARAGEARMAVNDIVGRMHQRPARQRVSDLLAVVLTLSARTRRMVMPKVEVDLDVFAPGGERAVRMRLPE
jgi:hypothetical protein